jgi:(1->4)-alpha-D-glucan 1-alpha-D-glucosylmutase
LAGMPDDFAAHVRRWFDVNGPLRSGGAPDPVEEYFVYQNLLAAWPIEPERLERYMEKALREAKRNTNWVEQNHDWEDRVKAFCRGLYDHRPFRDSFDGFAARVADAGERAALAQLLIKLTAPGVADIYQGDELVSLSLVDPDNRRPVDWQRRRELLPAIKDGSAPDSADVRKMRLVVAALDLRKRRPEAFAGAYEPVAAGDRAIAYMRRGSVFVAAEVFPGGAETLIDSPAGTWRDAIHGRDVDVPGRVRLADLLDERGIALLER